MLQPRALPSRAILWASAASLALLVTALLARVAGLPAYFQTLALAAVGVCAWAVNVHVLAVAGIDLSWLMAEPWTGRGVGEAVVGSRDVGVAVPAEPRPSIVIPSNATSYNNNNNSSNQFHFRRTSQNHFAAARNLYLIAAGLLLLTFASVLLFSVAVQSFGEERSEIVPAIAYVIILVVLFLPFDVCFAIERRQFLGTLKRIAFEGLASRVFFADVILADILTSFSRVVGDLHIVFTDLLSNDPTHGQQKRELVGDGSAGVGGVEETSWQDMVGPFLISLPFLFRLRQCVAEYTQSSDPQTKTRHMLNALKYLSAVPVIASSWLINWLRARYQGFTTIEPVSGLMVSRVETVGGVTMVGAEHRLDFAIGVWIMFSVVNSVYSLYWDVYMDWNLGTLRTRRPQPQNPSSSTTSVQSGSYLAHMIASLTGTQSYQQLPPSDTSLQQQQQQPLPTSHLFLRPHLHFRLPAVYHLAIIIDVLLRMSWIVKVTLLKTLIRRTLRGDEAVDGGASVVGVLVGVDFALKFLEIFRRWVWVFFRCEREWVVRRGFVKEGREVGVGGAFAGGGGGIGVGGGGSSGNALEMGNVTHKGF